MTKQMKPRWEDGTSYQRNDPRVPRVWIMYLRGMRITMHRHRDHAPDVWLLTVHGTIDVGHTELKSKEIDDAKAEALATIKGTLLAIVKALP